MGDAKLKLPFELDRISTSIPAVSGSAVDLTLSDSSKKSLQSMYDDGDLGGNTDDCIKKGGTGGQTEALSATQMLAVNTPIKAGTGTSSVSESSGVASGNSSHAEGESSAEGSKSHAEGDSCTAVGNNSHAEGYRTTTGHYYEEFDYIEGNASHAEGSCTKAEGDSSHAEGSYTKAEGDSSHAEGYYSKVQPVESFDEGQQGLYAHAEGSYTTANGDSSHVEGYYSISEGKQSHAEGECTEAIGTNSHSEGAYSKSYGEGSHAEGYYSKVQPVESYNEGQQGLYAHAEGSYTTANGDSSHVEGYYSISEGKQSHAEGECTEAIGTNSHSEGAYSKSYGEGSHAEGVNTRAQNEGEHAEGQYNQSRKGSTDADKTIHSVGIGTADSARANAHEIMQNGDNYIKKLYLGQYGNVDTPIANKQDVKSLLDAIVNGLYGLSSWNNYAPMSGKYLLESDGKWTLGSSAGSTCYIPLGVVLDCDEYDLLKASGCSIFVLEHSSPTIKDAEGKPADGSVWNLISEGNAFFNSKEYFVICAIKNTETDTTTVRYVSIYKPCAMAIRADTTASNTLAKVNSLDYSEGELEELDDYIIADYGLCNQYGIVIDEDSTTTIYDLSEDEGDGYALIVGKVKREVTIYAKGGQITDVAGEFKYAGDNTITSILEETTKDYIINVFDGIIIIAEIAEDEE